jgi:hypothetical protein
MSSTARVLDAARGEIKALREQLATQKAGRALEQHALRNALDRFEAVRALHRLHDTGRGTQWCDACQVSWPCPTTAALDGEPQETPLEPGPPALGRPGAVPGTRVTPDPPAPLRSATAEGAP